MINEEGGSDPEQFRMEAMFDRMDAIGKGMLGLTIQCAQCHSHKYDPLTHTDWILTPHPGEAARLLGMGTREIQADRFAAVRELVASYGGVCVLKGAGTLIASLYDGVVSVCDRGNPGMASGGMGDVLTGVIAALRAQGLSPRDAACLGVWVHAAAGDDAAAQGGEIGLIASDLLAFVRARLNRIAT